MTPKSRIPSPVTPKSRIPSVLDTAFLTEGEGICELVLVRHGQQAVRDPALATVSDWADPELSDLGRRQAHLLGRRFAEERIDAVITSPLKRAYDTGAEIARHHGAELLVVDDLREVELFRDMPPGSTATDILGEMTMAGLRERMIAERRWDIYPLSESSAAFRNRVVTAMEAIAATHPGKRVAVACHGGVVNAYVAHLVGSPMDMLFRPAHTSVSVVRAARYGVRAVQSLGDHHHLTIEDPALVTF